MVNFLYSEIIIFCLLILLVVYKFENSRLVLHKEKWLNNSMVYVGIVYLLADLGWFLTTKHFSEELTWLLYVFKMIFFISRIIFVYIWFILSEIKSMTSDKLSNKLIACSAIPVALSVIMVLLTGFTHHLFYFTENGEYIRGPLYNLNFLLFDLFLIFIQVKCSVLIVSRKFYADRQKYISIFMFCLPLLVSTLVQHLCKGMPVICIGMAIAVLQMQLSTQNQLVTVDELTGLNNRTLMLKYLKRKMDQFEEQKDRSKSLFLFIIDIDDFKQINDTYGHVTGDEALKIVAESLKTICSRYNSFCCRYGGDEFIMISELTDYSEAENLSLELNKEINVESFVQNTSFKLTTSIGYSQLDYSIKTIPDFIDKADKMLYIIKRNKKTGR